MIKIEGPLVIWKENPFAAMALGRYSNPSYNQKAFLFIHNGVLK